MHNIRIGLMIVLILTTVLLSPIPTAACSCAELGPAQMEMERSTAMFKGEVLDIKDANHTRKVLIKVEEAWKGVEESQVIVVTGLGGGDCGFEFQVGREYLVYASGEQSLSTNMCDRTSWVQSKDASEDFEVLGQGVAPNTIVDLSDEFKPLSDGVIVWVGAGLFIILLVVVILVKWSKSY
ncbi:hypothetical protein [Ornithinibacillus scapharcae]|uniref:hypothetical protein n=1 Tax=Ornithinibacillus scapharcae TaxID=1147159 RepID=UPI000225ADD4|nr:hypothetical protein [Ornithinibacillus scapharcae]